MSLFLVLRRILWIILFSVDVNHNCFTKSSLTDRTINHKFMNSWQQISCIHKHIFVQVFIMKIFKVLRCCIFNMNISKLVIQTFIIQDVLPIATFLKYGSLIKSCNLIFARKFNNTLFDIVWIFMTLNKISWICNQHGTKEL